VYYSNLVIFNLRGVTPHCESSDQPTVTAMHNEEFEHHSDPLDVSVAQQERILEAQRSARKPSGPVATGLCFDPSCKEQLVSDEALSKIQEGHPAPEGIRRWCNAECRDAWEREFKTRAR
jgi:hypothetical protein